MTTHTYVSLYPYTLQMRIALHAKRPRVLVLALWLVNVYCSDWLAHMYIYIYIYMH